jgi:tRNA-(ms[2]io[6]A)-hydroxylase
VLKLATETSPAWTERALAQLDEILLDHAHCEKKAAGVALTLLFQYPERASFQAPLAALAREELSHFETMLGALAARGVEFRRQRPSAYAGVLRAAVSPREPERLVDTLLCSALIEARSCERLGLLADALQGAELARLYAALRAAEARHHGLYVELACELAPRARVAARLAELAACEVRALVAEPLLPRLHSGA